MKSGFMWYFAVKSFIVESVALIEAKEDRASSIWRGALRCN